MITPESALARHDVQRLIGVLDQHRGYERRDGGWRSLADKLRLAHELPPHEVPPDLVTMHSSVVLRETANGQSLAVTLVFPRGANPSAGEISVLAPLGTAIFGARVGDIVEVQLPAGMRCWRIETMLYQPEAAGDHHL